MDNSFLKGKTILVTGGTGTFGHAFVAKLLAIPDIKKIIIFSRDEFKQSVMQNEVNDARVRYFLGDVRDLPRLDRAFNGVDIVVHAAALKQVPALEYNPLEAIKTNVLGTQNVVDAALDNNVEKVLFVSSDKAVQPVNLYGASKLCAERLVIAANAYRGAKGKTKFSVVRYGNVIGSRGSIVELVAKQKHTGVLTLTDERMTRFWIKVDNVMNVILTGLGVMEGGEIFVPKMNSLKVVDVLKTLAPNCTLKTVGVRPGEKMHEILITEYEARRAKDLGLFYAILPEFSADQEPSVHANKPNFPVNSLYVSNHKDFLLPLEKAKEVLES
ncbi:UDP-N-acetylglucosamine 4,6-dehydratase (inverting) [Candidatus Giovannonibacteria bacterium]|nr:UDP-N-acetylglucosamine 4,6-dehydratase (inverting) [Candidatus Giovannonibacteria bacterium]